ncbi:MAG: hypothetical protein AB7V25_06205 [Mangrovibacterium sp.]
MKSENEIWPLIAGHLNQELSEGESSLLKTLIQDQGQKKLFQRVKAIHSALNEMKNKGVPIPSVAFFHIPVPEFKEAIIDPDARFYGTRKEQVACSKKNTGLFSAFKKNGDVMAVFVGHDHLNDYVVCWKEIMLCYGRVTGSRKTSHYNHPDGSNGARVIELTEGERAFESWIRLRTGEKIKLFQYPFDFIDK